MIDIVQYYLTNLKHRDVKLALNLYCVFHFERKYVYSQTFSKSIRSPHFDRLPTSPPTHTSVNNYVDFLNLFINNVTTEAVAQWVKAFAPQAEGWVFEFHPRQT